MDESCDTIPGAKPNIRLSQQQKDMLYHFMNENPQMRAARFNANFTYQSAQLLWSKLADKLNNIPGAKKTWIQWRRTWTDLKMNTKRAEFPTSINYRKRKSLEDTYFNEMSVSDDSKDNSNIEQIKRKRTRASNVSNIQKKLLYNLVNSNEKLKNTNVEGCLTKRKEWKKIAFRLNSVPGPHKTWPQWKKCWHDIRKYYVQEDIIEKIMTNSSDDIAVPESTKKRNHKPNMEENFCVPSASQINYMIKHLVHRPENATSNPWKTLSNELNTLGPCTKNLQEWKEVWVDYKTKLKKFVDRSGTKNFNSFQKLTYEYIKREDNKDLNGSVDSILTDNQLQSLQQSSKQECTIIGSLVAVKLRSMQKEQKLIAEKLISEILFQGQMEMFQFSDKVVNIPGYT